MTTDEPDATPADRDAPTQGELPQTPLMKRRIVRAVGLVLILGIIYYSLFVVLPSQIDTAEVRAALQALTVGDVLALLGAGLLVMIALGWGSKASLPGLSLYRGTESSATSQVTAFVVPPPGDMVVRFAMYRTYNFTDEQSAVAVLIAMIARYAAVFFMPIVGLGVVLVSPQRSWTYLLWFVGLGALFAAALVLLLKVIRSDSVAHKVGAWLQRVASAVIRFFRRTPPIDLEDSVVEFGARMRGTLDTNMRQIVAANLGWGFANVLVMFLALRFSGLNEGTLSASEIVLVTGSAMALNSIPVPGGFAITESVLLAIVALPTSEDTAAFTAGLFLYRIFTWLLPMPVGGLFFLAWRWRIRREADSVESATA